MRACARVCECVCVCVCVRARARACTRSVRVCEHTDLSWSNNDKNSKETSSKPHFQNDLCK